MNNEIESLWFSNGIESALQCTVQCTVQYNETESAHWIKNRIESTPLIILVFTLSLS